MKNFFLNVLATVVGILVFLLLIGFFGVMSIVGMVASTDATTKVKDNSVLVLKMDGSLEERAEDNIMTQLSGVVGQTIGLEETLNAIKKAKENDNVKGIYIEHNRFQRPPCRRILLWLQHQIPRPRNRPSRISAALLPPAQRPLAEPRPDRGRWRGESICVLRE